MSEKINKRLLYCPGIKCKKQKRGDKLPNHSFYPVYKKLLIEAINYSISGLGYTVKEGDHVCNACILEAKQVYKSRTTSTSTVNSALTSNPTSIAIQQNTLNIDYQEMNNENNGYNYFKMRYLILKKLKIIF
jgi:hypothetical protein